MTEIQSYHELATIQHNTRLRGVNKNQSINKQHVKPKQTISIPNVNKNEDHKTVN